MPDSSSCGSTVLSAKPAVDLIEQILRKAYRIHGWDQWTRRALQTTVEPPLRKRSSRGLAPLQDLALFARAAAAHPVC